MATAVARRAWTQRFAVRLVAAMLVVSVPLLVVLAVLLTTQASSGLSSAGKRKGVEVARAVTVRVEDWLSERRENVDVLALEVAGSARVDVDGRCWRGRSRRTTGSSHSIELTDLSGKVLASSGAGATSGLRPVRTGSRRGRGRHRDAHLAGAGRRPHPVGRRRPGAGRGGPAERGVGGAIWTRRRWSACSTRSWTRAVW